MENIKELLQWTNIYCQNKFMNDNENKFVPQVQIKSLEDGIKNLEDKFKPGEFAKHLIDCLKGSKKADTEIKQIIRELIKGDNQCKKDIEVIASELYSKKSDLAKQEVAIIKWRLADKIILPILLLLVGGFIQYLVSILIK